MVSDSVCVDIKVCLQNTMRRSAAPAAALHETGLRARRRTRSPIPSLHLSAKASAPRNSAATRETEGRLLYPCVRSGEITNVM